MNKNIKLAKKYGAKILHFKDLPKIHQYSLIHYMAVDGEAWDVSDELDNAFNKLHRLNPKKSGQARGRIIKGALRNCLEFYVEKYGNWKFGVVEIPTKIMIKEIMESSGVKGGWENWRDYHNWYKECGAIRHPKTNRWPSILSSFNDEVIEDGWHRFHCYAGRGDKTIPCVFYPENCKPKKIA